MRFHILLVAIILLSCSFIAPQEILVRYGTPVICELTDDITLDDKPGKAVQMVVKEDVLVDGAVVIAKGAPVSAAIRVNNKPKVNAYTGEEKLGELLIDIFSVKAVDGSEVKFQDIYIQKFAEKNYNWFDKNRKWLLGTGVVKNCATRLTVTIQVP
ncbi:MAG: hypothetical protein IPH78_11365 [Bacteroidetes bacterium]|nr:hypothetical protein [Bacteroidota bacterium]